MHHVPLEFDGMVMLKAFSVSLTPMIPNSQTSAIGWHNDVCVTVKVILGG